MKMNNLMKLGMIGMLTVAFTACGGGGGGG